MNKKQLIVAWIMGVIICFVLFLGTQSIYYGQLYGIGEYKWQFVSLPVGIIFQIIISYIIPILIIGSLLIYTLRDKKK